MSTLALTQIERQARQEMPDAVDARQHQLTRTLLAPHQKALYADFYRLRRQLDAQILSKPLPAHMAHYPKHCCLEISKGVLALLNAELQRPRTPGVQAVRRFVEQGGRAKRVWGNLRDQYFQNALQFGGLYVDVANDTVDPQKPKVEIMPIEKANFHAIQDYATYAHLAENYWQAQAYPNRYLPTLAVLFPVLLVYPSGQVQLHSAYQMLLYQNLLSDFGMAEAFLLGEHPWQGRALPTETLTRLQQQSGQASFVELTHSSPATDSMLLAEIHNARATKLQYDATRLQGALDKVHRLNRS